jgi:glycosyltransferase involved in cell wall biosynthesis
MKILVVCQYYYPEQFRINEICEQLVKDGNSVTVLTGLPNYPTGVIPTEYRNGKKRNELINGVNVIRCFEIGRKQGFLGMTANYISYMLSASVKAIFMKKDLDIILIYQLSPITMALPGVLLKKISKKPLYLYCCDIWPESMKNIVANEKNVIYKIVNKFSKYIYTNCDQISVTSKPFIDYLGKQHMVPVERISYIPQHSEELYLDKTFTQSNDIIDFVFMGNIGIAQDIDCILNAAEMIKDVAKFKIHFVGDGSYLEKSKAIVKQKEIENLVIFHGRYPFEKMKDFYEIADACLLTLRADNLVGMTMPSKLQGYMAAGKPVIAAIDGAAREVILESNCGICVKASDSEALAMAMKDFILDNDKYKACGENGREYFKLHFTKDIFMKKLEEKMHRLLEGKDYV